MKKIIVLFALTFMLAVIGLIQPKFVWAESSAQIILSDNIIDGDNTTYDFSSVSQTIIVSDGNVTLRNLTITSVDSLNINYLIRVESNATLTLENVNFVLPNTTCTSVIYNSGKVTINNCTWDNVDLVHIINNSDTLECVKLLNVPSGETLNISLKTNSIYVDKTSVINGKVVISLYGLSYEDINNPEFPYSYEGKVLVKGVGTLASKYIKHFKFLGAPDEDTLETKTRSTYFEDFVENYYIDYAGILGDDISTINDGIEVSYGDGLTNIIDSGDIILTKFDMKLNVSKSGDETEMFEGYEYFRCTSGYDYQEYFFIGGKYATSRLFIEGLQRYDLQNFKVCGKQLIKLTSSLKVKDNRKVNTFALDSSTSLFTVKENEIYINLGTIPLLVVSDPVNVNVCVGNKKFEYNQINHCNSHLENNCVPYYITEETGKKVYLTDDEYYITRIEDNVESRVNNIVNAGSYKIYATSADDGILYTGTPIDIVVTPITLGVDFGNTSFVYSGNSYSITPVISNVLDGDIVELKLSGNEFTLPGNYSVDVEINKSSISAGNYVLAEEDKTCSVFVDKKTIMLDEIELDVNADGVKEVVYDGTPKSVQMLNTIDGVTCTSYSYTTVGEYSFNVTFNVNSKLYYGISSIPVKLVITPKVVDFGYIELEDIYHVYNNKSVNYKVPDEILNNLPEDASKETLISGDGAKLASDTPYSVRVQFKLKSGLRLENYSIVNNVKYVNIYISKATLDLSALQFIDRTYTFDGTKKRLTFVNPYEGILLCNLDNTEGLGVGDYTVQLELSLIDQDNYNPVPNKLISTLTIIPITLDVSKLQMLSKTYTYSQGVYYYLEVINIGSLPIVVNYSYYLGEDLIPQDPENPGVTNAGEYRVIASFGGKDVYHGNITPINPLEASLIIKKKELDYSQIKFSSVTYTYNGQKHMLPLATSPYGIAFNYSSDGETSVGNYQITATPDINANNYIILNYREINANLIIVKAKYDMSNIKFADINVAYDGLYKTAYIKGKLPDGVVCTYRDNSRKDVGNNIAYAIFTIPDTTNYEEIPDMTCRIIIEPRVLEITLPIDRFTYTGNLITPNAQIASGILDNEEVVATCINPQINAGTYYTTVALDNPNYKPNKSSYKFTIDRATIDTSQIQFEDVEVTYDGKSHTPSLVGNFPEGVIPNVVAGNLINAGEYIVYVDFTIINHNYKEPDRLTAKVTINKKPILIEFSGFTGLIEDGTKKDIGVAFVGVLENSFNGYKKVYSNEPINAGKYTLTINLDDNSNYEIIGKNSKEFEILTTSKIFIDNNYQLQIAGAGFSASSELTIQASNKDKVESSLREAGVSASKYKAFKIMLSGVQSNQEINVSLKISSINLKNTDNIKVYRLDNDNLEEITYSVAGNQLNFASSVGEEIVVVEEESTNSNNTLIYIAIGLVIAVASGIVLIVCKKRKQKEVNHFIND